MSTEAPSVVEADIDRLRVALDAGEVTSVELVARYLNRIAAYDRGGIRLNAVPVLNASVFDEARDSDVRRARGEFRGPLDGIPFTAKDSYRVAGLTVAAGSPAFADLIAGDDAFTVARLREAGAILLGLTNMPPMAAGGMQRGLYGRAESPYNGDYLTSAFGSGSSNGSGSATAASFAAFGLGEETWSSGRAPASHNALVAYTPSRGVISVRGNWPLVPTMDVVVPHTRTIKDLLHVLDAVVADDPDSNGDFWRMQTWIQLPRPSEVRPESFADLEPLPLEGLRLAVPRIYINQDSDNASPIVTRDSILRLWGELRADLEAAGAQVVEADFPVVDRYEKLHPGDRDFLDRGFVSRQFLDDEVGDLAVWAMDAFLHQNGDPTLNSIADADAAKIFPQPPDALPDRYGLRHYDISYDIGDYVERAREWQPDWRNISSLEDGLRGLERTRREDFEKWLDDRGFDAVIFPTQSDVGPADADVNPASAERAWRNGVWVSNGNLVPRHLGIPTVVVPMGTMEDTGIPVGLTMASRAYSDTRLIRLGLAIAALRNRRTTPTRTPTLDDEAVFAESRPPADTGLRINIDVVAVERQGARTVVEFSATIAGGPAIDIGAYVDGVRVDATLTGNRLTGSTEVPLGSYLEPVSTWMAPFGPLVVLIARDAAGGTVGAVATTPLSPL
jgi:amidase